MTVGDVYWIELPARGGHAQTGRRWQRDSLLDILNIGNAHRCGCLVESPNGRDRCVIPTFVRPKAGYVQLKCHVVDELHSDVSFDSYDAPLDGATLHRICCNRRRTKVGENAIR